MISSLARVKFIKTKVIFRYHTKGVSKQVSSNSDIEIKSYSCSNSNAKMGKSEKKWDNIFWIRKRGNKGITNRAGFRDYKSGQEGLQIGAALGISNRGKKIANRGRVFKLEQRD